MAEQVKLINPSRIENYQRTFQRYIQTYGERNALAMFRKTVLDETKKERAAKATYSTVGEGSFCCASCLSQSECCGKDAIETNSISLCSDCKECSECDADYAKPKAKPGGVNCEGDVRFKYVQPGFEYGANGIRAFGCGQDQYLRNKQQHEKDILKEFEMLALKNESIPLSRNRIPLRNKKLMPIAPPKSRKPLPPPKATKKSIAMREMTALKKEIIDRTHYFLKNVASWSKKRVEAEILALFAFYSDKNVKLSDLPVEMQELVRDEIEKGRDGNGMSDKFNIKPKEVNKAEVFCSDVPTSLKIDPKSEFFKRNSMIGDAKPELNHGAEIYSDDFTSLSDFLCGSEVKSELNGSIGNIGLIQEAPPENLKLVDRLTPETNSKECQSRKTQTLNEEDVSKMRTNTYFRRINFVENLLNSIGYDVRNKMWVTNPSETSDYNPENDQTVKKISQKSDLSSEASSDSTLDEFPQNFKTTCKKSKNKRFTKVSKGLANLPEKIKNNENRMRQYLVEAGSTLVVGFTDKSVIAESESFVLQLDKDLKKSHLLEVTQTERPQTDLSTNEILTSDTEQNTLTQDTYENSLVQSEQLLIEAYNKTNCPKHDQFVRQTSLKSDLSFSEAFSDSTLDELPEDFKTSYKKQQTKQLTTTSNGLSNLPEQIENDNLISKNNVEYLSVAGPSFVVGLTDKKSISESERFVIEVNEERRKGDRAELMEKEPSKTETDLYTNKNLTSLNKLPEIQTLDKSTLGWFEELLEEVYNKAVSDEITHCEKFC